MFKDSSDKFWGKVTLGIIAIMLVIAGVAFFGKDDGDPISGWEALGRMGASFWAWAVVLSVAAGAILSFGIKVYNKELDVKVLRPFLFATVLFLGLAWGKGCDVKTNGGVTAPKGRLVKPPIDTNRVAAEDLLPNKK